MRIVPWLTAGLLLLRIGPAGSAPPKATVYLFLSTDCPVAGRYGPRIVRLAETYRRHDIRFVALFPNYRETDAGVRAWMAARRLTFPARRDRDGALARRYGATRTPEAVVLDPAGRPVYRGRIDDNDDPARVRTRDLAAALAATRAGKRIARPRVPAALGCALAARLPSPPPAPALTYHREVAPILARHCLECHTPGGVGAVPLHDYAAAAAFASKIREQTARRKMPPWKARSDGEFFDERGLSAAERETLAAWAQGGAPEGKPEGAPPPAPMPRRETLGEPDAALVMPEPYATPAEGKDFYRCFVFPTRFDADRWVQGIEFTPGNRAIVHHVSAFIDRTGAARRLDAADPGPGYTNPTPGNGPGFSGFFSVLGGWTPGHTPRRLPPGVGLLLPRGADLVLEIHYHLSGKPETDRTRFALFFAREPVTKRFRVGDVSNGTFRLRAGATAQTVEASRTLTADVTVYSVTPHMHQIGKAMEVSAELPSGEWKRVVAVPDWDFNWQPSYRFKEPLRLPRGTRIEVRAVYDNSAQNPNNPHRPPREVVWGESTDDEMCTVFFGYTLDAEALDEETVVAP